MPKKIETEKQRLFCNVFIISVILIAENAGPLGPPLATPMSERLALPLYHTVNPAVVIALRSQKGEMKTWGSNF